MFQIILQSIIDFLTFEVPGVKQAVLPLAIPLAMAGMGVAGKVFSAIKGGKANREAARQVRQRARENEAWYNVESNRDFMQSNVARNAFTKVLENIDQRNRDTASAAAITGATDASTLAAKEANRAQLSEVTGNIAAMGTARQDQIGQEYRAEKDRLMGANMQIQQNKAKNAALIGEAAGDLMGSAAGLLGQTKLGMAKTATGDLTGGDMDNAGAED